MRTVVDYLSAFGYDRSDAIYRACIAISLGTMTPEQKARVQIDALLTSAGWTVQDHDAVNLYAGRGVAVREFGLKPGHGTVDYLLYVDQKAAGVIEAKLAGHTLTGVETQSGKYSDGLPDTLPSHRHPLPSCTRRPGLKPASPTFWIPNRAAAASSPSIPPMPWPIGSAQMA